MRILVTGAHGNLGSELVRQLSHTHTVTGVDIDTMNITDAAAVRATIANIRPDIVIHCAALTAVDYCAEHPDEALNVNAYGAQNIALACQQHDAALLYISSNEIFSGRGARHYAEYDPPDPINPYGYSKWVGEQMVRDLVTKHYIVRTSWLFAHGGRNFIQIILGLANNAKPIRVVTNEVSSPTYTTDLAAAIARLITTGQYGIYHLVNDGIASRFAFARYVLDHSGFNDVPITPIALAEYSRASRPPEYTVLRNYAAARLGIMLRPWQEAVTDFLNTERLKPQSHAEQG